MKGSEKLNHYSSIFFKEVNTIGQNIGKVFEENWKKSCPEHILIYRPPDAAQSFDMSKKLRFSRHSPCDYMMFDGGIFYAFELKTFEGSCSFERDNTENGIIHFYQVNSLKQFYGHKNVCSGFVLDFRKTGNTYFLSISEWETLTTSITKKSFNEKDLLTYCSPILIEKKKIKVNYRYNIEKLMNDIKERKYYHEI